MKQEMKLGERFTLLGFLPKEGNFATLKVLRKLKETLSLTEEEIKYYEVKHVSTNGGETQITWNAQKAQEEKEFEFGEFAEDLIVSKLKKLDADKKLEEKHFSLYEKFITNPKKEEDGKNE